MEANITLGSKVRGHCKKVLALFVLPPYSANEETPGKWDGTGKGDGLSVQWFQVWIGLI